MILITSLVGFALLNFEAAVEKVIPFEKNATTIAEMLLSLRQGIFPPDLQTLEELDINLCDDPTIADHLSCRQLPLEERRIYYSTIESQIMAYTQTSPEELSLLRREVSFLLVEKQLKVAASSKDLSISQAISAIDEIDQTINLFTERLNEWYGLHFSELEKLVGDNIQYCTMIAQIGWKEDFKDDRISAAAKTSMGVQISGKDMHIIQCLAKQVVDLGKIRESYTSYIEEGVSAVAPNMTALVGPLITARLIALAGGLKNLSKKPASTMQMLGAEKALFRHLKTGAKPPKHGIIFQHPLVHNAKYWQRGKIARTMAAELSIAARIDYFSGEMMAQGLIDKLEARVNEIRKKNQYPPRKKNKKGGRKR